MAKLFNLGHLPIPPFVADAQADANRTALPDECVWGVLGGFKCIHDYKTGWDYAMAGNARVNDIYDSLVQEFRRTNRESGTAQQKAVESYDAADSGKLRNAMIVLSEALRKRGAW